jgi:hypothetical protein
MPTSSIIVVRASGGIDEGPVHGGARCLGHTGTVRSRALTCPPYRPLRLGLLSLLLLMACTGDQPTSPATPDVPKVGQTAPGFELRSSEGEALSLEQLLGRRPILLYFSMGPG